MSDPVSKSVKHSNLPRSAGSAAPRAEVGATTDPLPEGKIMDAEPKHHFKVIPEDHDVGKAEKTAQELGGVPPEKFEKLQRLEGRQHISHMSDVQAGMDFSGAATSANKKLPSKQRTEGLRGRDK